MRSKLLAAGLVACVATSAHAGPPTRVRSAQDEPTVKKPARKDLPTVPIVLLEQLVVIVPPTIYYWRTPDEQKADWALRWDWPSWREKLTSLDPIVLDTNKFEANAIRHPMVGALTYQIGRGNGWSPGAAGAVDFLASGAGEDLP